MTQTLPSKAGAASSILSWGANTPHTSRPKKKKFFLNRSNVVPNSIKTLKMVDFKKSLNKRKPWLELIFEWTFLEKFPDHEEKEREFPSGSVVRSPCFHCWGPGFNPWWGNKNPTSYVGWKERDKKKKEKEKSESKYLEVKVMLTCPSKREKNN